MGLTSNKKTPISTETAHKTQHVQPLPIIIEEQREPKNLAYYQGLKFVKKLMGSYDTNVSMMENNIVKKVYFRKGDGPKQFANEVATLIYLLKCDFVPNILAYDSSELAVYMNYINGIPRMKAFGSSWYAEIGVWHLSKKVPICHLCQIILRLKSLI